MPDLAPWTKWCHGSPGQIYLPSGDAHQCKRGAEQGDLHSSLQRGVVLAGVTREMQQNLPKPSAPLFSLWFADDGQLICRPEDVDGVLVALDCAAASVGATRGGGADVKTCIRLVGHPDALSSVTRRNRALRSDRAEARTAHILDGSAHRA